MLAKDTVSSWLKNNPMVFRNRMDGNILTLIELGSGKQIQFNVDKIEKFRITPHPQGLGDYLNLILENGKEIVLCYAGLAFSPSFLSTGPLPDAPPVSCMADYYKLVSDLKSIATDSTQKPAALLLFNVLISILDGAKEIGLDVGYEEEKLDKMLSEFEKEFPQQT